jgi:hypothetical protein
LAPWRQLAPAPGRLRDAHRPIPAASPGRRG